MADYAINKEVEAMIVKVMKKKELNTEKEAIAYMLGVATGRLRALWRYDDKLEGLGKSKLGILTTVGKKKRAPKSAAISTRVDQEDKKPAAPAKRPKRKAAKRKTKAKPAESEQIAAE